MLAVSAGAPCVCDLRGQLCMRAVGGCLPGVHLQPCSLVGSGEWSCSSLASLGLSHQHDIFSSKRSKQNLGNTGKVRLAQR